MPSLIVVSGPSEGEYYPLDGQTVVVGRDAACPIQIVDEKVSRVHLEVRFDEPGGSCRVKDLKSVNGVKVNARAVTSDVELRNGDLIELGNTRIMFLTRKFPSRKSAWDYYKMSDQRRQGTLREPAR